MASPLARGRARAAERQSKAEQLFKQNLSQHADPEELLIRKIEERMKQGGTAGLVQQFKKFNNATADGEISYEEFKTCLYRFGLNGLPEVKYRELFAKYDSDGNGGIDFREFSNGVTASYQKRDCNIGESARDLDLARRAREKVERNRKLGNQNHWKAVDLSLEPLFKNKMYQHCKCNSLKAALRKYDMAKDSKISGGNIKIDFKEFQRLVRDLGLSEAPIGDIRALFNVLDRKKRNYVSANDFAKFMSINITPNETQATERSYKMSHNLKIVTKAEENTSNQWKYLSKNITAAENILVNKFERLIAIKGGARKLRRMFNDRDIIDENAFKLGLSRLGFDAPDDVIRKLFSKYVRRSHSREIELNKLITKVMNRTIPLQSMTKLPSDYLSPKSKSSRSRHHRHRHRKHHKYSKSSKSKTSSHSFTELPLPNLNLISSPSKNLNPNIPFENDSQPHLSCDKSKTTHEEQANKLSHSSPIKQRQRMKKVVSLPSLPKNDHRMVTTTSICQPLVVSYHSRIH